MERNEQQLNGWRKFRFNYGSLDQREYVAPEVVEDKDFCCSQESCGNGCYVAVVDVDRLDQQ